MAAVDLDAYIKALTDLRDARIAADDAALAARDAEKRVRDLEAAVAAMPSPVRPHDTKIQPQPAWPAAHGEPPAAGFLPGSRARRLFEAAFAVSGPSGAPFGLTDVYRKMADLEGEPYTRKYSQGAKSIARQAKIRMQIVPSGVPGAWLMSDGARQELERTAGMTEGPDIQERIDMTLLNARASGSPGLLGGEIADQVVAQPFSTVNRHAVLATLSRRLGEDYSRGEDGRYHLLRGDDLVASGHVPCSDVQNHTAAQVGQPSTVDHAVAAIVSAGAPLHISDIAKACGKERNAIVSQVHRAARDGKRLALTGPATYATPEIAARFKAECAEQELKLGGGNDAPKL